MPLNVRLIQMAQKEGRTLEEVLQEPAYGLSPYRDREGLALGWAISSNDQVDFRHALKALGRSERLMIEETPGEELVFALGCAYELDRLHFVKPLAEALLKTKNGSSLLREDLLQAIGSNLWTRVDCLLPFVVSEPVFLDRVMEVLLKTWPIEKEFSESVSHRMRVFDQVLPQWTKRVSGLSMDEQNNKLRIMLEASVSYPVSLEKALREFSTRSRSPLACCELVMALGKKQFEPEHQTDVVTCLKAATPSEVNACRDFLVFQWADPARQSNVKALVDVLESGRAAKSTPIPDRLLKKPLEHAFPWPARSPGLFQRLRFR